MSKSITFEEELSKRCSLLVLGVIQCKINNNSFSKELWNEIDNESSEIKERLKMEEVKQVSAIKATREAYKKCGKDPNRYRPSAEQLNRRVLQNKDLYQITTAVDLINLVSLKSGYSIGGFDADKIQDNLRYGIGKQGEIYKGIGRGLLNIEGLPVLRDEFGGIGTPTSDEERTMLSLETKSLLMNINAFDGKLEYLEKTVTWSVELLRTHLNAEDIQIHYFQPSAI